MTPDLQSSTVTEFPVHAVAAPGTRRPSDQARAENLRYLWPDAVDLAKQPGLLYRLHAILTN